MQFARVFWDRIGQSLSAQSWYRNSDSRSARLGSAFRAPEFFSSLFASSPSPFFRRVLVRPTSLLSKDKDHARSPTFTNRRLPRLSHVHRCCKLQPNPDAMAMDPASTPPDIDPIISLLTTYNELNASSVDEFVELPSALEFMRYVARNRPLVVRGGAKDWEATRTWNVRRLKSLLEGQSVNVAVTPNG